jgi:hypothetical protein
VAIDGDIGKCGTDGRVKQIIRRRHIVEHVGCR